MTLRAVPPPEPEPAYLDVQPRTTDAGNARAFLAALPDAYRYVVQWEAWLRWTGTHWQREGADIELFADIVRVVQAEYAVVVELVKERRAELLEASKAGVGSPACVKASERLEQALALLKFLHGSQNTAKIRSAMVQLEAPLSVALPELDRDPWLLACPNGTIELRTGALRPNRPADLLTQCLRIDYDPEAQCRTWLRFLESSMKERPKLALYLQRLAGYTLTGTIQEHLMVFCYGSGRNGKSTFLRVMHDLLGPYGVACPRTLLFAQKGSDVHPTEIATLYGMRMGVCSEVGEDTKIDEPKVKDLTGGDPLSCRRMNENFWRFFPTHKLWLAGNHKPVITGTDYAIWARLRVIPWEVQFSGDSQDKDLPAKLAAEMQGILAWAVQGCLDWQKGGLNDPPEVLLATAEYRDQSDPVADFFRAHLVFEPAGKMTCRSLRKLYEGWCEDMGHSAVGARRLGARLRGMKVLPSTQRVDGKVVDAWAGVRQLNDYERAGGSGTA